MPDSIMIPYCKSREIVKRNRKCLRKIMPEKISAAGFCRLIDLLLETAVMVVLAQRQFYNIRFFFVRCKIFLEKVEFYSDFAFAML